MVVLAGKKHLSQLFVTIYTLSSTVIKDEHSTIEEISDFSYPVTEAQIPKGSTVAVISGKINVTVKVTCGFGS